VYECVCERVYSSSCSCVRATATNLFLLPSHSTFSMSQSLKCWLPDTHMTIEQVCFVRFFWRLRILFTNTLAHTHMHFAGARWDRQTDIQIHINFRSKICPLLLFLFFWLLVSARSSCSSILIFQCTFCGVG